MCADNKKCKACSIAGIFNTSKMKKSKINFKGVTQTLINGASGAALKMGFNFLISKVDKEGKLSTNADGEPTPMKKELISLAVPLAIGAFAPKLVAKPIVKAAIDGHVAITFFQLGLSQIKDAETKAAVAGYNPVAMAGYNPVAMAGFPKLPYQNESTGVA